MEEIKEMTELQFSKKHMVDVRKKTIRDYLYNDMVRKFVFVLFCASLFFFGLMYGYGYIESHRFFPFMAVILVYLLLDPEVKGNIIDFPFMIISLTYLLMSVHQIMINPAVTEKYDPIPYAWVVPTVYLLGKMIVGNCKSNLENKVFLSLLSLGSGMYLQGVLNYSKSFGLELNSRYVWPTFWTIGIDGARTLYNFGFLIISSAMLYAILTKKKPFIISTFVGIVIAICLDLHYLGRTMVLMTTLVLSLLILLRIISVKNRKKTIYVFLIISLVLLLVIYLLYYSPFAENLPHKIHYILHRDGGIIHNVRIELWKQGLISAKHNPRGDWSLDEATYGLSTSHNSWIELSRQYDIVIFALWCVFILVSLSSSIIFLKKFGEKYKILHWAVACEAAFFIIGMIEPYMTERLELQLFYIFIIGIVNGIKRCALADDIIVIRTAANKKNLSNEFIVGFGILSVAFIISSYMDWRIDRFQLIWLLTIPIAFVVGGMTYSELGKKLEISFVALICVLIAIFMYCTSISNEFFEYGYFVEVYTKNIVDKSVMFGLLVLPISMLIGGICYHCKLKMKIEVILMTLVLLATLPFMKDGRFASMREAIRLQLGMTYGEQWIASKDNYSGLVSSHNMWIDSARDYGILMFGVLAFWGIWSVYCFARVVKQNHKSVVEYIAVSAFIIFTFHFMIEASSVSSRYIFVIGVYVYGLISSSVNGKVDICNNMIIEHREK